jgi:DNA adenine methylase
MKNATIFYLLNRTSYSGTTLSGGMAIDHDKSNHWEKINPRFNKASVERLRNFSVKNLTVNKLDFRRSILKHKDAFVYADPPYFIGKKKLYGNQGDMQFEQKDHENLAKILKKRKRWVLSYNDTPEVRKLYRGFRKIKTLDLQWSYGMSDVKSRKEKHSNEILILSKDISQVRMR